ncbi:MAG: WD40/YVTN/BNR-like repeat-containing protein [Candidatus Sulfotelmatobacter sp.]
MRAALLLLLATTLQSQAPHTQPSITTADLRGVSAVSPDIAWASGSKGTYLRTIDGGKNWIPDQVPGAESLDFRAVVAFSADEAFLMSAGSGDKSRIYHTTDVGRHWQLEFTNTNPKGFFDSMVFWDRTHGIVLGDPIPDETGKPKFELLITNDGQIWTPIPSSQLPPAIEGEGAFAASNTCLAILRNERDRVGTGAFARAGQGEAQPNPQPFLPDARKSGASAPRQPSPSDGAAAPAVLDPNIWFATGGKVARVFHSSDRGVTWQVFPTPIMHGMESAGIFSIAFRDPRHGVIAGGDYKHPEKDGPNLAFTDDGGKTWIVSEIYPQAYSSAVAYDRRYQSPNAPNLPENQAQVRLFLVAPDYIYDFRPPRNPTRIGPPKKSNLHFNAVSPLPQGGALIVGPNGSIATIP